MANGGILLAVTASSATNAFAVGQDVGNTTLILRWNGSAWKRVRSPAAAGASLFGVTMTSASNAWAVGSTSAGQTLILRWNGTAWH